MNDPKPNHALTGSFHPQHRWLRRILITVGILVALVVICELLNWSFLKSPISHQLSQALQRPVQIGDEFGLRLLGSIRLKTSALYIGPPTLAKDDTVKRNNQNTPPEKRGEPDLLRAENLILKVPYSTVFDLLRSNSQRPPRIAYLEIGHVQAHLLRDEKGQANWTFGDAANERDKPEAKKTFLAPEFDHLLLREGQININDAIQDLQLTANVSTAEGQQSNQQGGLRINANGRYLKKPITEDRTNKASFCRNPIIGNRCMRRPIALSTPKSYFFASTSEA